jgi:hypothetical protein
MGGGIRKCCAYYRDLSRQRTSGQLRSPSGARDVARRRFSLRSRKLHSAQQRREQYRLQRPATAGQAKH